jgi:hypothetical protein
MTPRPTRRMIRKSIISERQRVTFVAETKYWLSLVSLASRSHGLRGRIAM